MTDELKEKAIEYALKLRKMRNAYNTRHIVDQSANIRQTYFALHVKYGGEFVVFVKELNRSYSYTWNV